MLFMNIEFEVSVRALRSPRYFVGVIEYLRNLARLDGRRKSFICVQLVDVLNESAIHRPSV